MATALDQVLLHTAMSHLRSLGGEGREGSEGSEIDRADPQGLVSPRSRMLCAGLACLARACYQALGGRRQLEAVGDAAAMLSLLTKIDDQVIDDLDFHGGPLRPWGRDHDRALDRRTRAFLQPTLDSLRWARAVDAQPRCRLAAQLGQRLQTLACSRARLEHVLDTIAFGWEVQVRAVRLLSSDPRRVDPQAIAAVNADISGAWLLMITMIGELPEDAARPLSSAEALGFYGWGRPIQSADALADLQKDTADGLVASVPGVQLATREPALWRRAFVEGEVATLYAAMAAHGIDRVVTPTAAERVELAAPLAALGQVPEWLAWIHGFLTWRWLRHPLHPHHARGEAATLAAARALELVEGPGEAFGAGWARWLGAQGPETQRLAVDSQPEAPCSAP